MAEQAPVVLQGLLDLLALKDQLELQEVLA